MALESGILKCGTSVGSRAEIKLKILLLTFLWTRQFSPFDVHIGYMWS